MSTTYIKVYTRDISVLCVQYWYRGERDGLAQVTCGNTSYAPMFVYEPDVGVSAWYSEDSSEDARRLIQYFKDRPSLFAERCDWYMQQCRELRAIVDEKREIGFVELLRRIVDSMPNFTIAVVLGEEGQDIAPELVDMAVATRAATDTVAWAADAFLQDIVAEMLGEHADWRTMLTAEEIIGVLPSPSEIEKRKTGWVFFQGVLYPGMTVQECEKRFDIVLPQDVSTDCCEITGQIANGGVAHGTVRVLRSSKDCEAFVPGEVLVASMTTPNYISAMKRAIAFVTDEGGITCHAAIIARELGVPCIIGTKIATKVLKDGDVVEVDAEKGVVTIVKRI